MTIAVIPDPSALVRALARRPPRAAFLPILQEWVAHAGGQHMLDLWLLDGARENLTRFAGMDLAMPVNEDLAHLFQDPAGTWSAGVSADPSLQVCVEFMLELATLV